MIMLKQKFALLVTLAIAILLTFNPISIQAQDKTKAAPAKGAGAAAPTVKKQSPAPGFSGIPVVVVDVQKIYSESKSTLSLREQLDEIRRIERDKIVKQEDKLSDEQQELNRQRTILSVEAYQKKLRELERKAANFSRELEARKQQIDISHENSMAVIRSAIYSVISEIAKVRNIDLVFTKAQVLMVDSKLDITDEVLKRIDEKLPKVKLDLPGSGKQ